MDILRILLGLPYWSWIGMTVGILIVIFSFVLGYKSTTPSHQDIKGSGQEGQAPTNTQDLLSLITFRKNELRNELNQ